MVTLALEAVSSLMVSWASLAHLVLVPALLALTIRPVVTSALAAVLWRAMMEGVGAAWWPVVVHAAWWLAAYEQLGDQQLYFSPSTYLVADLYH